MGIRIDFSNNFNIKWFYKFLEATQNSPRTIRFFDYFEKYFYYLSETKVVVVHLTPSVVRTGILLFSTCLIFSCVQTKMVSWSPSTVWWGFRPLCPRRSL